MSENNALATAKNLQILLKSQPFLSLPSGIGIAHWWCDSDPDTHIAPCNRFTYAQGCDGIDLWRSDDGQDYCYMWVEVFVDHDYTVFFMLDIRTSIGPEPLNETRDHLFVAMGAGDGVECEWQNTPIEFAAPTEQHRERFSRSMDWFADRMDSWRQAHD